MQNKEDNRENKLSDQAIATVMLALQKCILEQSDITEILKGYNFSVEEGELVVTNPPTRLPGVDI